MKLSAFIGANLDAIVSEWEAFARALPAGRSMTKLALRDHCREILVAIALDMETSQTREQQARKSKDIAPAAGAQESAAESHGTLRHLAGFDLVQLVAEFRALRASVLSLWERSGGSSAPGAAIQEITRFNEGLDQSLAESVESYSTDLADSRDLFVGVLGHDLRGPLSVITMSNLLLDKPDLSEPARVRAVARSVRAAKEMNRLITDLLDYTRSRLGEGIPIAPAACDLAAVCHDALDAIQASHPEVQFKLETSGDLHAQVDGPKLGQALANLLGNAVQHGDRREPITLGVADKGDEIVIEVGNRGDPIPSAALGSIFEPMTRAPSGSDRLTARSRSSMGLGLFIAREIVVGHQGSIDVDSGPAGTTFTIRLPRAPAAPGPGA
jgi:signal transduction histidine kinase